LLCMSLSIWSSLVVVADLLVVVVLGDIGQA
jgi:hypothetical protein